MLLGLNVVFCQHCGWSQRRRGQGRQAAPALVGCPQRPLTGLHILFRASLEPTSYTEASLP